jgi:chemotaxis protein MotB
MGAPVFRFPERKTPFSDSTFSREDQASSQARSDGENSYIVEEMLLDKLVNKKTSDDGDSIWLISYSDLMTLLFGFFVMLMSFSRLDVEAFEKTRKETTELFGGEYQKPHTEMADELKKEVQVQGLSDKALFDELEKGIALTFRGSAFFDPGSASIKPEAMELLRKVIPVVKKQQRKYNVVVEGHTDDNPIQTEQFPSNWELSSQRASAVLRLFEASGFDRMSLRSIGFADTLPVVPNRDSEGKVISVNQNQNRRVVIKLVRSQSTAK